MRFISSVIIDGEWQTQVIGLVIRGTEDTKGYTFLFKFVEEIIGNKTINIMADMAKFIQKAARECFLRYNFVFCFIHFKQNFLKNIKFTPSEDLWLLLQSFMKGETSENVLREKWCNEESNVDAELKGYNYLCKMAHFLHQIIRHTREE